MTRAGFRPFGTKEALRDAAFGPFGTKEAELPWA